jgi:hypothetical protein
MIDWPDLDFRFNYSPKSRIILILVRSLLNVFDVLVIVIVVEEVGLEVVYVHVYYWPLLRNHRHHILHVHKTVGDIRASS